LVRETLISVELISASLDIRGYLWQTLRMGVKLTSRALDKYFRGFLDIDGFASVDKSLNGIQVDNDGAETGKIAFAVDASLESFQRAAGAGAGLLFVHHGLFWGQVLPVAGSFRQRLRFLLERNICLYAVHLPLDQHPELGNNASVASLLGLQNIEPFGNYSGKKIGYKGSFASPLATDEAVKKISFMNRPPVGVFPFGKAENATAAVIAGGAPFEVKQAIEEGVDLYITGDPSHSVYHECLESKINMIAGGHYNTEVWGLCALMRRCEKELGIEVEFIDVPTGL